MTRYTREQVEEALSHPESHEEAALATEVKRLRQLIAEVYDRLGYPDHRNIEAVLRLLMEEVSEEEE